MYFLFLDWGKLYFLKQTEESKLKKIITISLLTLALNATAGWGGNSSPWNNNPWGGSNSNNGIFGNNPYSLFTPDWFSEEMEDMMDEFDSNNNGPWGNNGFNNSPWNNNNFNNGPWNNKSFNNSPWNNKSFNNGPWNNKNFSNGPWANRGFNNGPWNNKGFRNSPWSNYGYNKVIPTAADVPAK